MTHITTISQPLLKPWNNNSTVEDNSNLLQYEKNINILKTKFIFDASKDQHNQLMKDKANALNELFNNQKAGSLLDLSGIDLSGMDLTEQNEHLNINFNTLSFPINLTGANLSFTKLDDLDLSFAETRNIRLEQASLKNTKIDVLSFADEDLPGTLLLQIRHNFLTNNNNIIFNKDIDIYSKKNDYKVLKQSIPKNVDEPTRSLMLKVKYEALNNILKNNQNGSLLFDGFDLSGMDLTKDNPALVIQLNPYLFDLHINDAILDGTKIHKEVFYYAYKKGAKRANVIITGKKESEIKTLKNIQTKIKDLFT